MHWQTIWLFPGSDTTSVDVSPQELDMQDESKTKEQLLAELREIRKRVAELEKERVESKRAAETPRTREALFRMLFEESPFAIALNKLSGEFVDVNQTFCGLPVGPMKTS